MSRRRPARHTAAEAGSPRPPAVRGQRKLPKSKRRHRSRLNPVLAAAGIGALVVIVGVVLLVRSAINNPADQGTQSTAVAAATVEPGPAAIGRAAPDFTASTFDGGKLSLSGFRGKPVMVNFFASWCTSCAHELPVIEAAFRAHQSEGFVVVGVNTLENGDGVAFYHRFGLTFPAVYDPGQPGRIGAVYGVTQGLPASVFIDKQGRIDQIVPGEVTSAVIGSELRKLQ